MGGAPLNGRRRAASFGPVTLGATAGALAFLVGSGLLHMLPPSVFEARGSLMLVHRWIGALLYPVFVLVSVRHVARMAGRRFAGWVLAAQALPIVGISTFVPPSLGLAVGVGLCVPLALGFRRVAGSEYRRNQLAGFGAFALTFATLFSGVVVGLLGPEALAGDVLSWSGFGSLHRWAALTSLCALALHVLRSASAPAAAPASRRPIRWPLAASALTLAVPVLVALRGELRTHPSAANETGPAPPRAEVHLASLDPGTGPPAVPAERWHGAADCTSGGCHLAIAQQWSVSAHRFSASNRGYRKVVELLIEEEGEGAAVFCARCHDPVSVMLGIAERDVSERATRLRHEGISCAVCHLVTGVDEPADNGALVLTLDDPPGGDPDDPSRFLRRGLVAHSATYGLPHMPGDSARIRLCAGCHRIDTPVALNGGVPFVQEDTVTEMLEAKPAIAPSCDVCHMTLNQFEDPVHARPDHRVFGTLSMLSALAPDGVLPASELAGFDALALAWRKSGLKQTGYDRAYTKLVLGPQEGPAARLLSGPRPLAIELSAVLATGTAAPPRLVLEVRTRNGTAVHSVPTGPLGLNELWLEVRVTDAAGRTVFASGALDGAGRVTGEARRLGATLVDRDGNTITHDRLWRAVGTRDARLVPPGGSVEDSFEIALEPGLPGPLAVSAAWRYRRYNAEMAEWVFGDVARVPVVELARQVSSVELG